MKNGLKRAGVGLLGTAVAGAAYVLLSPRPSTQLVKKSLSGRNEIVSLNFDSMKERTHIRENLDYDSAYENGFFDLIRYRGEPKNVVPTLVWIHGGSFVGGDKEDVIKYATAIASNGFNVVNINYALAPDAKYPVALQQIKEVYEHLVANNDAYDLDLENLYFAGDSTGAQLAAQFVAIQLNDGFSPSSEVTRVIPEESIKGVVLLSGVFDFVKALQDAKPVNRFVFKRIGWSYTGVYNWETLPFVAEMSLLQQTPEHFAPTFISDGNKGTFLSQSQQLAESLAERTAVTTTFYDVEEYELGHRYQFEMNHAAAEETFRKLIMFLRETTAQSRNA